MLISKRARAHSTTPAGVWNKTFHVLYILYPTFFFSSEEEVMETDEETDEEDQAEIELLNNILIELRNVHPWYSGWANIWSSSERKALVMPNNT